MIRIFKLNLNKKVKDYINYTNLRYSKLVIRCNIKSESSDTNYTVLLT